MDLKKLRELINGAIYITPHFHNMDTKRWKFSVLGVVFIVLSYTLAVAVFVTLFLFLTPAKDFIFTIESKEMTAQKERVKELETRVVILQNEIDKFLSANRKLKLAVMLGTKDSVDASYYDSLRSYKNEKTPVNGGSIYTAFESLINKLFKGNSADSLYFISPATGAVINKFEPKKGHMGIDYAAPKNSAVVAAAGGTVIFADFTINDGYKVIIDHHNKYMTIYKHCSTLLKEERENVVQGETIALSGKSGENSSGYHLHFEIWYNNKAVDPAKLIIN